MGVLLERNEYENPPIVKAIFQVVVSWTLDEMLAVSDQFAEEARTFFSQVNPRLQEEFWITGSSAGVNSGKSGPKRTGLDCLQPNGVITRVEPSGIIAAHEGPYVGRDKLAEGLLWWTERICQSKPDCLASRVSVLVENVIEPKEPLFRVEEYITPHFEFPDENLEVFSGFEHRVGLDLAKLAGIPMRGVVVIRYPADSQGIGLTIDVLDEGQTAFDKVRDRIWHVKSVESHVFEKSITEKTRKQYGCRR